MKELHPPTPWQLPWTPEEIAERFHNAYEYFAPKFGYRTRLETAVAWDEVPEGNKALMIAVVRNVLIEQMQRAFPSEIRPFNLACGGDPCKFPHCLCPPKSPVSATDALDAKRYRWLRSDHETNAMQPWIAVHTYPGASISRFTEAAADEQVDQAMRRSDGKDHG